MESVHRGCLPSPPVGCAKMNGVELPPGRLAAEFAHVDDGHGSIGVAQISTLVQPAVRSATLSIWFLW